MCVRRGVKQGVKRTIIRGLTLREVEFRGKEGTAGEREDGTRR